MLAARDAGDHAADEQPRQASAPAPSGCSRGRGRSSKSGSPAGGRSDPTARRASARTGTASAPRRCRTGRRSSARARACRRRRNRPTSFGSTGMTMPSASMSSRTVTKMKMKAARRRRAPGLRSAPRQFRSSAALPPGVRVRLLAQRQPDRRARQVERLAQAVDEIAPVGLGHRVGAACRTARRSAAALFGWVM